MLARLWRRVETEPDAPPKPPPPIGVCYPRPKPTPPTAAPDHCPKRRRKRVRICRLYPKPQSQPLIHARTLIALVQEECPQYVGGYIPRPDLEACYRELCAREDWQPRHWTAIARHLGEITKKKSVRDGGERFVGYQVPRP